MFYTYAHYRVDTNEIFYIGKGQGNRHLSKRYHNTPWCIAAKHGWRSEILAWWPDEAQAFSHERLLIRCLGRRDLSTGSLVNKTAGGQGTSGTVKSNEIRAKIRAANIGKTHSAETRAKMSAAKKGYTHSAEQRAKRSAALKGRPSPMKGKVHSAEVRSKISAASRNLSAETRAKRSASLKGRTVSAETRAKISAALKGKSRGIQPEPQLPQHLFIEEQ